MRTQRDTAPEQNRLDAKGLRTTMKAIVTMGPGGYDQLQVRVVSLPTPGPGEVLLQVLAAGINNTDINTRVGWYSSSVAAGAGNLAAAAEKKATAEPDGGWNQATPFPLVQGTDCCGHIVAVAPGGDKSSYRSALDQDIMYIDNNYTSHSDEPVHIDAWAFLLYNHLAS